MKKETNSTLYSNILYASSLLACVALQGITCGIVATLTTMIVFAIILFYHHREKNIFIHWSRYDIYAALIVLIIVDSYAYPQLSMSSPLDLRGIASAGILSALALPSLVYLSAFIKSGKQLLCSSFSCVLSGRKFLLLCAFISSMAIFAMVYASFSYAIGMDEEFTLCLTNEGYRKIIDFAKIDAVHPPLYYLFVKFFVDILTAVIPSVEPIHASKLVSVIPYIIFLIVCLSWIRKRFGNYVAGLASVAVCCMPRMMEVGVTIRMYSWTALWVACCFIQAHELMRKGSAIHWILFAVFSLLTIYTNYWGGIAIGFIYLYLFMWGVRSGVRNVCKLLVVAAICTVCFLPWLSFVIESASRLGDHSWCWPVTWSNTCDLIMCYSQSILNILLILLCCHAMWYHIKHKSYQLTLPWSYSWLGISIPVLMLAFAIVIGLLHAPILNPQHLIPGLFVMWLGISMSARLSRNKHLKVFAAAIVISSAVVQIPSFIYKERQQANSSLDFVNAFKHGDNKIFFASNASRYMRSVPLLERTICAYPALIRMPAISVYAPYLSLIDDKKEIRQMLRDGREVYFIEDINGEAENFEKDTLLLLKHIEDYNIRGSWHVYRVLLPEQEPHAL